MYGNRYSFNDHILRFISSIQLIFHSNNILCISPLNAGGLIKKMINNARLTAPKIQDNFAMLFHSLFRLKTKPHEIIAMPKFNNATSAERPWIKPVDVGGSPGISVGNIAKRKAPTQKIPKVIMLVFDALTFRDNASSRNNTPVASDKNAVVISQLKSPTAYSLTKQDMIFLSGRIT